MLVTIRHLPREAYRDMSCIYNETERVEFAKDQLNNNNYVRVADIEMDNISGPLTVAYEMTNSITEAWVNNPEVIVANEFKDMCRSTSLGYYPSEK